MRSETLKLLLAYAVAGSMGVVIFAAFGLVSGSIEGVTSANASGQGGNHGHIVETYNWYVLPVGATFGIALVAVWRWALGTQVEHDQDAEPQ